MANGIPTRYEAITFCKAGAIPNGGAVATYSVTGAPVLAARAVSADGGSPMLGTIYNPHATTVLLAGITTSTVTTSMPTSIVFKVAAGGSQKFIVGPGQYMLVWGDALGTAVIESYNATVIAIDNS